MTQYRGVRTTAYNWPLLFGFVGGIVFLIFFARAAGVNGFGMLIGLLIVIGAFISA